MKNTKRALGISLLALLLCVSMFVGTTFAWFTDSVTVAGNKIQAGTLDIELWQNFYGSEYDNTNDVNITDSKEPLFNHDNWEPGYLDFVNLTVKNVGSLAVKIKANLIATSEIGKLAEVIDVYVVRYPLSKDPYSAWGTPSSFTVRDLINGFEFEPYVPAMGSDYYSKLVTKVGTLKDVLEQGLDLMPEQIIEANNGDQSNYQINIALKMREEAGNEYQGETAGTFDIRILAAQATVESDSFDNLYDEKAEYPDLTPDNQKEFNEAVAENPNGTIVLDSVYSGTLEIPAIANGLTVDASATTGVTQIFIAEGAKDITFVGLSYIEINNTNGDQYTLPTGSMGTITLKNCNVSGATSLIKGNPLTDLVVVDCTFSNGARYPVYDNYSGFKNVTVRNCTFTDIGDGPILIMGSTESDVESLTVDNCTFINCTKRYLVKCPTMKDGGTVTFTNNTLINCLNLNGNPFEIFTNGGNGDINYVISGNTLDGADFNTYA